MEWNARLWRRMWGSWPIFWRRWSKAWARSERRAGAARYVQGLLLPGGRKSIEPLAERLRVDARACSNSSPIVRGRRPRSGGPWPGDHPSLGPLAAWIVDETGLAQARDPFRRREPSILRGRWQQANCQVAVELAATDGQVAAPLGARLYLPQSWTQDPARGRAAGGPAGLAFATKTQLALA